MPCASLRPRLAPAHQPPASAGAFVTALYRYPIKGFSGQLLSRSELRVGAGLEFDRFLGITNGQAPVVADAWSPCQGFVRMTKNTALPLFEVRFKPDEMALSIAPPGAPAVVVDLTQEASVAMASRTIASWFPEAQYGSPRLERRCGDLGWWDHADAAISIINVETVKSLSHKAQRNIDPLRFRGNLYVGGITPWTELAWVGHRIGIGDAELEVLRPIDRCRATSVDPTTAAVNLNVPALIATHEGHIFCGVYARVVRPGLLRAGDVIEDLGPAPEALRVGAASPSAPALAQWPRVAEITECVPEGGDVTSFWLKDPLAAFRVPPSPGQHLRLHLAAEGQDPTWRSYTISGVEGHRLRISVKNGGARGRVSRLIHDTFTASKRVLISGPFGSFRLHDGDTRPLILVSAGIGITPIVAMLRELGQSARHRPVHVVHGAVDRHQLALWHEVCLLTDRLSAARRHLFLSRPDPDRTLPSGARRGRVNASVFAQLSSPSLREAEVYICGPSSFVADVRRYAQEAGADPKSIHSEAFVSPSTVGLERRPAPADGPFCVRFAEGGVDTVWRRQDGTLLDLAEAAGLALPANCRAGVCGACRQTLVSGSVAHLVESPFSIAAGEVLACCAVPTSDVVLSV